jgi:leucine dehydrogenase
MGIDTGKPLDPGPYTAQGVFAGIRATIEQTFGDPSLSEHTILIQGIGDVGEPLARALAQAGARVLISDLDDARSQTFAAELGGESVDPDAAITTDCDVYGMAGG